MPFRNMGTFQWIGTLFSTDVASDNGGTLIYLGHTNTFDTTKKTEMACMIERNTRDDSYMNHHFV